MNVYSFKGTNVKAKEEITKVCNKLSLVNLVVKFNREKYNLYYKSHIYKSKTST